VCMFLLPVGESAGRIGIMNGPVVHMLMTDHAKEQMYGAMNGSCQTHQDKNLPKQIWQNLNMLGLGVLI